MRRRDVCSALWREAFGTLPPATRVIVAGAGPSGLHLALALAAHGLNVTVYEPARCGGVRIPLMHACNIPKRGSELWQAASRFAREWYSRQNLRAAVEMHVGAFGKYFSIHTRTYLRLLRRSAQAVGVQFIQADLPLNAGAYIFLATGAAAKRAANSNWSSALAPLPGWESYMALRPSSLPVCAELVKRDVRTNYFTHRNRAAFIHLNGTERAAANAFGVLLHPGHRHALYFGIRLTTRDRLPVVGYALADDVTHFAQLRAAARQRRLAQVLPVQSRTFLFTGMGFHAMTYSPFLADRVAQCLTGKAIEDEILLGTLTPARFLPR